MTLDLPMMERRSLDVDPSEVSRHAALKNPDARNGAPVALASPAKLALAEASAPSGDMDRLAPKPKLHPSSDRR
jgi:hypothetical protein